MDKYIEELKHADCFNYLDNLYIVTADFKKSGEKNCINLKNGCASWFKPNTIVQESSLYSLDKDNNFYPIKNQTNVDTLIKNNNLS
jgi:hypothetical protein